MTTMRQELARKQPANAPVRPVKDDGRTIDGRWRATRGGMTFPAMLRFLAIVLIGALFAGFILSQL